MAGRVQSFGRLLWQSAARLDLVKAGQRFRDVGFVGEVQVCAQGGGGLGGVVYARVAFAALLDAGVRHVNRLRHRAHHQHGGDSGGRNIFRRLNQSLESLILLRLGIHRRVRVSSGQHRIDSGLAALLIVALVEHRDAFGRHFGSHRGSAGPGANARAAQRGGCDLLHGLFRHQPQGDAAQPEHRRVADRFRPRFPQSGVLRHGRQHLDRSVSLVFCQSAPARFLAFCLHSGKRVIQELRAGHPIAGRSGRSASGQRATYRGRRGGRREAGRNRGQHRHA